MAEPGYRRLTDDEIAYLSELRGKGYRLVEIANILNITPQAVAYWLKQIRTGAYMVKPRERHFYFTYPRTGGTKSVAKGILTLDFYNGTATLPDGTEEQISDSLESHSLREVRSIFIQADQNATGWLDESGRFPINANEACVMTYQNFRALYIETTVTTNISVWSSTHPMAALDRAKRSGLQATTPTIYNVTLTSADTEYKQALPSKTKKFTVQCRTASDVKLAFTEGESGTNYVTIKANTNYYEDNVLAESLTLYMQSTQAGVVVEIIAWT